MASIPNCKNYRPGATLVTSPTSSVHSNQPGAPIAGQAPLVSPSLSDVTNSNESDISVLTSEEIEALKMYSHSVQNFSLVKYRNPENLVITPEGRFEYDTLYEKAMTARSEVTCLQIL
ncbi:hypothetical protein BY996DRAFT_6413019 [Phakopsora pachyrhizi]|nr:hypothetical protein BY996DRAFT_6413019 [Phakopsora pachyrhizi]